MNNKYISVNNYELKNYNVLEDKHLQFLMFFNEFF